MPLTKSDIPNLLLPGIQSLFFETYRAVTATAAWAPLTMVIDSNKEQETYAWLGAVPKMREFLGERVVNGLSENKYTLLNKTYEDTLGIDRTAIEDDQYGQIRIQIQQLATEAARHTEEMIFTVLAAGSAATYGLCYDGQYFIDTDHANVGAEYTTSQSNKGTSALSSATLKTGITAMQKFKNDRGTVMGVNPTHLAVPPDLEWTAREILESVIVPDATAATYAAPTANNVLRGRLQLIVSPYLTDANDWFLLDCSKPVKPMLLQKRTPCELESVEKGGEAFMKDKYLYGARERKAVGYGLWQLCYGAIV